MKKKLSNVEKEKSECAENEMDNSYKLIIYPTFIAIGLALFELSMFVLYLPTFILCCIAKCSPNELWLYYLVSVANVGWVMFVSYFTRKHFNFDELDVRGLIAIEGLGGPFVGAFMIIQIFSGRIVLYSVYLVALVLSQLVEFGIVGITNEYILALLKTNQYSIMILSALDQVIISLDSNSKKEEDNGEKLSLKEKLGIAIFATLLACADDKRK